MPPAVLALGLVALAALAVAAVRWRRAVVLALPFLAALNGLTIPLGGATVRADQLAACLLVAPLAVSLVAGTRRARVDATTWWLAAVLVANLAASAAHSPARGYSLLQCASLASVWLIYVHLLNLIDTRDETDALFANVLWAALGACAVAVIAFALAIAGLSTHGAEVSTAAVEHLTRAYGAYGTMVEPNILGSFAAAHLVLAVALLVIASRRPELVPRARLARWVAGVSAAALVLSFTRAAWLGALGGVALVVVWGRRLTATHASDTSRGTSRGTPHRTRHLARVLVPLGAAAALVVALLVLPGSAGALLRLKLLNLVNLSSQTAALRLLTYGMALQQTTEHPLVGWGTYTFAPLVAQGADFQRFENWRNLWIGNYLLLALHDTGVVGLALWVGLLSTILARGVRAVRALGTADPAAAARAFALTAAVATLLVPFLATSGFSLGYPWLLIGLLGAHARAARAARLTDPPVPPAHARPADAT